MAVTWPPPAVSCTGGIAALVLVPPIQQVRYDVERDFVPLGLIWRSPQVFAVSTKLRVKSVVELVAYAKTVPGKLTIGSAGNAGCVVVKLEVTCGV